MTIQSTECASEELADVEEWLKSKGLTPVDKREDELQPGEYVKVQRGQADPATGGPTIWKLAWHPKDE